ncbi:MAG: molybdopterin-dependent oxidoreductase [Paracoccaceae bacterium]
MAPRDGLRDEAAGGVPAGGAASAVATTCPYCGVGCGVLARPDGRGGAAIEGDRRHPANAGRLCSKGAALGETLGLAERLLHPEIDGARASWDAALDLVATRFAETIERHGPDSVAFYVSGQLLTEDYYVANKLMKGFIGSANIDTNSRLCMASSVAGHRRAFGTDTVPGTYEDLEAADLVVLVGSNAAWCHPVLFQRLAAARAARPSMRVWLIDPRATATAEVADRHLAIAPGSDVALFAGLLAHLGETGAVARDWVATHVEGLDTAMAAAEGLGLAAVAEATGLAPDEIAAFYDAWSATERVVTAWSQGVNQSVAGTDKVGAIVNCHLATGRIGRPGAGPFSLTGQPNAMGGREVGGLATMLAAHLDLESPEHRDRVRAFWDAPRIAQRPGLKAVEMFRAVADGRIKALWIMATNPAVSLPEAEAVRAAIAACPFTVISDVSARADTAGLARVRLPALAWGEKEGTVTSSDRTISRQRAFLPAPGEARADWRIVADVAARMGWREAFDYASPAEVFREHAALSGAAGRDFDISAWADRSDAAYGAMRPFRWPDPARGPRRERFFADGGFHTPSGRARAVATPYVPARAATTPERPFLLNTGRVRDQWHTMTRTGLSPRLSGHVAEPFVEIHPDDARALGIAPATLVALEGAGGRAVLRALVTARTARGTLFAPMHWSARLAAEGRIGAVIEGAVDPVSGQPGLKGSAVSARPFAVAWHALAVARAAPRVAGAAYWALARRHHGWSAEIAGHAVPDDWEAHARAVLGLDEGTRAVSLIDAAAGNARLAFFHASGRLAGAFLAGRGPVRASRAWLAAALGEDAPAPAAVLAGRAGAGDVDPGPLVCSCFDVGAHTIAAAVARGEASDVEGVGRCLAAGTGCGSCRPEIARLVAAHRARSAA